MGRLGHQDPGDFPEEVKTMFEKAVEYYEENMVLMVEIQEHSSLSDLDSSALFYCIEGLFKYFSVGLCI